MGREAEIPKPNWPIRAPLAATLLLLVLVSAQSREVQAATQSQETRQPLSSGQLVIQGRITAIQGTVVTVKTPNGVPGGPGGHAQFVVAGSGFKVDISRARVLLPDGRKSDALPLAIGDHVLVVMSEPGPESPRGPGSVDQTYSATIIERIVQSDRVITH